MKTTFQATIRAFGNNTRVEVPPANRAELGTQKRPPVTVTVAQYVYSSTVGVMGGRYLVSLPKVDRDASGLAAGDSVTVTLELLEGPRTVEIPAELHTALERAGLRDAFAALGYSRRKEHCR
jgi:Domain of unknown function (DUF1905)